MTCWLTSKPRISSSASTRSARSSSRSSPAGTRSAMPSAVSAPTNRSKASDVPCRAEAVCLASTPTRARRSRRVGAGAAGSAGSAGGGATGGPGGGGGDRGGGGIEGVEGADEGQALYDRAGDPGPVPEVTQACVGLAGDDALHLGVADALHLAQRAADGRGRAAVGGPMVAVPSGDVSPGDV